MRILISGASGFIGSALSSVFSRAGHQVVPLVRTKGIAGGVYWDPLTAVFDRAAMEGFDAVVHLAGENIAGRRWTPTQKARILESRVRGTHTLVEALGQLERRPTVLLSVSAIGFYGDRGSEILREDSPAGTGFLSDVCIQWEGAAQTASRSGIRVVCPRLGIVLSSHGGALPKMLLPFKLGMGGRIGSGQQYMSWITIDDLVQGFLHCLETPSLVGPVNMVSPAPVTNAEFTKNLGRVLSRPTIAPLPGFAARLILGEMADALLLASARVEPAKLLATRFGFRHRNIEDGLRAALT